MCIRPLFGQPLWEAGQRPRKDQDEAAYDWVP